VTADILFTGIAAPVPIEPCHGFEGTDFEVCVLSFNRSQVCEKPTAAAFVPLSFAPAKPISSIEPPPAPHPDSLKTVDERSLNDFA